MEYTTTHIVYFSPTHTSQKVARAIGEGLGMGRRIETDLTLDRSAEPIFIKDSLTVIAVPVYAGRVAPVALERIERLKGENSPVILVALYGNRDYEDALVELRDTVIARRFVPLSAGAFVGEHSYSRENMPIAEGRPDTKDIDEAVMFGRKSLEKLSKVSALTEIYPFYIKGNAVCGECIGLCPTNAIYINVEGKIDTDKMKCIKCCACVKECPTQARIFDTPYTAMLHEKCSARREVELFF